MLRIDIAYICSCNTSHSIETWYTNNDITDTINLLLNAWKHIQLDHCLRL